MEQFSLFYSFSQISENWIDPAYKNYPPAKIYQSSSSEQLK